MGERIRRIRLDQCLVKRGLAASREKAQAMIMAGKVIVDGIQADKPGRTFPDSSTITLKKIGHAYVSRGGDKLEAALDYFNISVKDKYLLDIGASTGGFTDCLLRRGAGRVIAVDVGYGQLDWRLRQDSRVAVMERTNARYLSLNDLGINAIHGAVIDVSFISLKKIVPTVSDLLSYPAFIIALIKPQFEVGKGKVGKGGVVRNPELHQEVVFGLQAFFKDLRWTVIGHIPSPLLGPKGNREFLMYLKR